jgi:uncharacterized protein YbcI
MARPTALAADATAVAVSDAVSRLYLDKFGKGAIRTDTTIQEDVIVTVLYDIFTPAEKALIDGGMRNSVLITRQLWQHATEALFREAVGQVTGRTVVAAVSGFAIPEGIATEVFVLAPQ